MSPTLAELWRRLRPTPSGLAAILVFLVVALPVAIVHQGERSPWLQMTNVAAPGDDPGFPLLGYSAVRGDSLQMKENQPSYDQVVFFAGVPEELSSYGERAFYGFVAAHLQPLFGLPGALVVLNLAAWAACVALAFRFAARFFEDELAGLATAVMVTVGAGTTLEVGDLSAHFLGFALFYGGIVAFHESRVSREPRPLVTHLRLGLFFAVIGLTYNTGGPLALAYGLLALRYNKWYHVLPAVLVALAIPRLWGTAYDHLSRLLAGVEHGWDIFEIQSGFAQKAAVYWRGASPGQVLAFFSDNLIRFSRFETIPVLALGVVGFATLVRDRTERAFWLVVTAATVVPPLLILAPAGNARGYVVYGMSILWYSSAGALIARGLRAGGRLRVATVLGLVLLVALQLAWDEAHLFGLWGPAKSFFYGLSPLARAFRERPLIVSLTGHEPTPWCLGGDVPIAASGLDAAWPVRAISPKLLRVLVARSFDLAALGGCLVALAKSRRQALIVAASYSTLAVLFAALTVATFHEVPLALPTDTALELAPHARGRLTVTLSRDFLEQIARRARPGDVLEVELWSDGLARRELHAGPEPIALAAPQEPLSRVPLEATLEALRRSGAFSLELEAGDAPAHVRGWQRRGLEGRTLEGEWRGLPVVPALELRLRSPDGTLEVGGF